MSIYMAALQKEAGFEPVKSGRGEFPTKLITGEATGSSSLNIHGIAIDALGIRVDADTSLKDERRRIPVAVFDVQVWHFVDGLPQLSAAAVELPLTLREGQLNPNDIWVGALPLNEIPDADLPAVKDLLTALYDPSHKIDVTADPYGITIDTAEEHDPVRTLPGKRSATTIELATARNLVREGAKLYEQGPFAQAFKELGEAIGLKSIANA